MALRIPLCYGDRRLFFFLCRIQPAMMMIIKPFFTSFLDNIVHHFPLVYNRYVVRMRFFYINDHCFFIENISVSFLTFSLLTNIYGYGWQEYTLDTKYNNVVLLKRWMERIQNSMHFHIAALQYRIAEVWPNIQHWPISLLFEDSPKLK